MLHKRINIKDIKDITDKDYYVRGCTALLDALGYAINFMTNVTKNDKKAENVLFIITTDGYENASKEYSYEQIRQMITCQKEKYNWKLEVWHGEYKGVLCGVQEMNPGEPPLPLYRFPGGVSLE